MCKLSDKLKLCSCKTENVKELKHYWLLKRPNNENHFLVGEMILPADIGKDADTLNQQSILKQLNEGNCFDVVLSHQENDFLELHFTYKADREGYQNIFGWHGAFLAYAFKFKKGKWVKDEYKPWELNFEEICKGKITKPFKEKTID